MLRILVIDDEKMILDLVEQALSRSKYRVETAFSAIIGIEKFLTENFDLVITDVCMPDVDGNSVVDQIRNSHKDQIPVIGISGTPWMLQNDQFDLILQKPFSIKTLISSVKSLIGSAEDITASKAVNA